MQEADTDAVLGDLEVAFERDDIRVEWTRQGDDLVAKVADAGRPAADVPLPFTFGHAPLQQFLASLERGRLQSFPVAWDTRPRESGGRRWFHVYGEERILPSDPLHWRGPRQNANATCIECHTTGYEKRYDSASRTFDSRWSELGVGCEACHGPASEHLTWAKERASSDGEDEAYRALSGTGGQERDRRWVFDEGAGIARLEGARPNSQPVEACAVCHSLRTPLLEGARQSEGLFDAYRVALLDRDYYADGQLQGETFEYGTFAQSKMYAAGVVCGDCHDSHSLALRAEGNALCATCHRSEVYDRREHHFHESGSPASRCQTCHMPTRTFMAIDVRHDHGFRVPRPDLAERIDAPDVCSGCHTEQGRDWAASRIRELRKAPRTYDDRYALAVSEARRRPGHAEPLLAEVASDRSLPAIRRATALALIREITSAQTLDAIRRGLDDPSPLVRTAALRSLDLAPPDPRSKLAWSLLDDRVRSVRLEAGRVLAPALGQAPASQRKNRWEKVATEIRRLLEAQADQPGALVELALLEAYSGDLDAAEASYRRALAEDPTFVAALVNLADVMRIRGRDEQAEPLLRRAVEAEPESSSVRYALGMLLQRRGNTAAAIGEIRRAAELDPDDASSGYAYGIALHSTGESEKAVAVLEATHGRNPRNRSVLIALATIQRDRGEIADARRWSEKLLEAYPEDPLAPRLLDELRGSPKRAEVPGG